MNRAFALALAFLFLSSCGKSYTEQMAVADANAWLSTRNCAEAEAALRVVHSSPDLYGYDGKVAWAAVEACHAGYFFMEFFAELSSNQASAGNFIEALVRLDMADHSDADRLNEALFNSSGEALHAKTRRLMESIRILQSTVEGVGTDWTNEVSANLLFLSLAAIGRFSHYHGYDEATGDFQQDYDLADPNINGEASCLNSYANQRNFMNDPGNGAFSEHTLGINSGPNNISRADACMLFSSAVTFNIAFAQIGSSFDEVGAPELNQLCDLGGNNLCVGAFSRYSTCLDSDGTNGSPVENRDLYGLLCVVDNSW